MLQPVHPPAEVGLPSSRWLAQFTLHHRCFVGASKMFKGVPALKDYLDGHLLVCQASLKNLQPSVQNYPKQEELLCLQARLVLLMLKLNF